MSDGFRRPERHWLALYAPGPAARSRGSAGGVRHMALLRMFSSAAREPLAQCPEGESAARNGDNVLTNTLLPEVSTLLLE